MNIINRFSTTWSKPVESDEDAADTRRNLLAELAACIKQIQTGESYRLEPIVSDTVSNSLCTVIEAIFLHGLKVGLASKVGSKVKDFASWQSTDTSKKLHFLGCITKVTHRQVIEQLNNLKQINTSIGKCRAWVRLAFNDGLMESYIDAITKDTKTLHAYYDPHAFLRDTEQSNILAVYLQGLNDFIFSLSFNSSILNQWTSAPMYLAGILETEATPMPVFTGKEPEEDISSEEDKASWTKRKKASAHRAVARRLVGVDGLIPSSSCSASSVGSCPDSTDARCRELYARSDITGSSVTSDGGAAASLMSKSSDLLNPSSSTSETTPVPTANDENDITFTVGSLPDRKYSIEQSERRTSASSIPEYIFQSDEEEDKMSSATTALMKEVFSKSGPVAATPSASFILPLDYNDGLKRDIRRVRNKRSAKDELKKLLVNDGYPVDTPAPNNKLVRHATEAQLPSSVKTPRPPAVDQLFRTASVGNSLTGMTGWSSEFVDEREQQQERDAERSRDVVEDSIYDENFLNSSGLQTGSVSSGRDSYSPPIELDKPESDEEPIVTHKKPTTEEDDEMDFVVVDDHGKRQMQSYLTRLCSEKGLDVQRYQCALCRRPVGIIYGAPRVCSFDGSYYCVECHKDEEAVIPAKILYNWDFRPHKVSTRAKEFLQSTYYQYPFPMDKINNRLYDHAPELREILNLRRQLCSLRAYLFTCKQRVAEEFRKQIWPREHLMNELHSYTVQDFVETANGKLSSRLSRMVKSGSAHVYSCSLCKQKGFYCELCDNPAVIFPFETTNISSCEKCQSVFHADCKRRIGDCPKCARLCVRQHQHGMNSHLSTADLADLNFPSK